MKILLTNDDGYQAKGLAALADIMKGFGDVTVIAPKFPQSGMSTAVSLGSEKIAYKSLGIISGCEWAYLDATPASCVKFGISVLMSEDIPELVVSGINHGSNASTAACYSGTLGAAEEASLNGIPAIGVSLDTWEPNPDFSSIKTYLPGIIKKLLSHPSSKYGLYYNINFPVTKSPDEIKGIRVCEMGLGRWVKEFVELGKEDEETVYKMVGEYEDYDFTPTKADNITVNNGYISIVPHNIINFDKEEFQRLEKSGFNTNF